MSKPKSWERSSNFTITKRSYLKMPNNNAALEVKPFSPILGAEIYGLDLSKTLSRENLAKIKSAFSYYQVLFFKDQKEIAPEKHIELGKLFGNLHLHPAAPTMKGHPEIFEIHVTKESKIANGEFWHSDVSCDEEPPLGTMLQLHVLPKCGGDTMFSNMYTAYESLSDTFKSIIDKLTATHESAHIYRGRYADRGKHDENIFCPKASHPVVRTHPETKKKALFVNRTFTTKINGFSSRESDLILEFLFKHAEHLDHQIRYRWSQNDLVFWDNRCCMHRAIWDYWPEERKGRRVTIKGDRPV